MRRVVGGPALLGAAVWLGVVVAAVIDDNVDLTLVDALLLLGPLVIVPLGFRLTVHLRRPGNPGLRAAGRLQPIAALLVMVSFLREPGALAGVLAIPWLAPCGLAAVSGLMDVRHVRPFSGTDVARAAALAYLGLGAGWLVLSRFDLTPLDLDTAAVELMAVHLHHAGFASVLIAAIARTAASPGSTGWALRFARPAVWSVVAGPGVMAIGTASAQVLETLGALAVGLGLVVVAGATLAEVIPRTPVRPARLLLAVSAGSAVLGMVLALVHAAGETLDRAPISGQAMTEIHGGVSAIGFVLCGLLGWLARTRTRRLPAGRMARQ